MANWILNGKDFTETDIGDNYGFVYLITNTKTQKKYIGKKFFYSIRTKTVQGKKKRIKSSSDWQTYHGSNDELKKDVTIEGEKSFKREILHLCKSKGECGYLEAREHFERRVLESEDYYNSWIMCRVHKTHIKALNERVSTGVKGGTI